MNLLAATIPAQPAPAYNPAYQNQAAYQNTTMQPDRPVVKIPTSVMVVNTCIFAFKIAIIIFVVFMLFKFVRAFEKIANRFDKGIIVKKEDTTT
jgi:hypothetical protein